MELEAYERLTLEAQVDGEKLREIQEGAFASFGPWLGPGDVGAFVPVGLDIDDEQAAEAKRKFNEWKVGLLRVPERLAMYRYYSRQGFGEKTVT